MLWLCYLFSLLALGRQRLFFSAAATTEPLAYCPSCKIRLRCFYGIPRRKESHRFIIFISSVKAVKEMKNSILALLLNDQKTKISSQKLQEKRDETNVGLTAAPNNDIKEEEVFDSNEESSAQTEDGDSN